MLMDLFAGEACRWCGRDLGRSGLTKLTGGLEKNKAVLFPVLCLCGGITVVGAGSFVSHIDDFMEPAEGTGGESERRPAKGGPR